MKDLVHDLLTLFFLLEGFFVLVIPGTVADLVRSGFLLLLGLGNVQQLSMDPHSIPKVKKIIRSIEINEAIKLANNVLKMGSAKEISQFIKEEMKIRFPEDFDRDLIFQEQQSV